MQFDYFPKIPTKKIGTSQKNFYENDFGNGLKNNIKFLFDEGAYKH